MKIYLMRMDGMMDGRREGRKEERNDGRTRQIQHSSTFPKQGYDNIQSQLAFAGQLCKVLERHFTLI